MKFPLSELMLMAMAEGDKARLHAPPNPWVGALIVNDRGVIVGEGHTQAPGESHAEIGALRRAGAAARGATMIVTLEPCCHVGRTGPCAEAIIEAGIARVVVATIDPDPRVSGKGIELLKASGVDVEVGVEGDAVRAQLAPYIWQRVTGRPYVVAKIASTIDGVVAMADGTSQWITGPEARRDAHVLRAQSQAIIVGAGTVRSDDPSLTARLDDIVIEPLRVVLGRAPEDAQGTTVPRALGGPRIGAGRTRPSRRAPSCSSRADPRRPVPFLRPGSSIMWSGTRRRPSRERRAHWRL